MGFFGGFFERFNQFSIPFTDLYTIFIARCILFLSSALYNDVSLLHQEKVRTRDNLVILGYESKEEIPFLFPPVEMQYCISTVSEKVIIISSSNTYELLS